MGHTVTPHSCSGPSLGPPGRAACHWRPLQGGLAPNVKDHFRHLWSLIWEIPCLIWKMLEKMCNFPHAPTWTSFHESVHGLAWNHARLRGLVLRRGETAPHRDSRPSVVKACLSRLQWELVLGCLWLLQSELRNVVKNCCVFSSVHARKYGPVTMDWSCVPCVPEQLMATLVRWAWSTQSFSLQRHQHMLKRMGQHWEHQWIHKIVHF